jgi:addiction module antitoxin, RelB/DinJ family
MTTTIRIDDTLKKECDLIFEDIGLTMSTAVTLFLKQVAKTKKIPFELKTHTPNKKTRATLDAIMRGEESLSEPFDTVDALMKDLTRA